MIELETRLRRWGNSFGIVIPISKIEKAGMKEGDEVKTLIMEEKKVNLRKLFGTFKFKKPTQQMMREIDKELYND